MALKVQKPSGQPKADHSSSHKPVMDFLGGAQSTLRLVALMRLNQTMLPPGIRQGRLAVSIGCKFGYWSWDDSIHILWI